jgi:hypothetical protein
VRIKRRGPQTGLLRGDDIGFELKVLRVGQVLERTGVDVGVQPMEGSVKMR